MKDQLSQNKCSKSLVLLHDADDNGDFSAITSFDISQISNFDESDIVGFLNKELKKNIYFVLKVSEYFGILTFSPLKFSAISPNSRYLELYLDGQHFEIKAQIIEKTASLSNYSTTVQNLYDWDH